MFDSLLWRKVNGEMDVTRERRPGPAPLAVKISAGARQAEDSIGERDAGLCEFDEKIVNPPDISVD